MSGNFVRGGVGEVRMADVLALSPGKGFWTRAEKEAAAEKYEIEHPGVIVVRDWWTPRELELAQRGRKPVDAVAPTTGMDPERALKELRRLYANIAGVEPSHVDYERLWTNWTRTAHELEDVCGLPRTEFKKGARVRKGDDPIPEALQEALNGYAAIPLKKKKVSVIESCEDAALLKLIRDTEPLSELQTLAVEKLAQMGAL